MNRNALLEFAAVFLATLLASILYVGPSDYDDTYIYMRYVQNWLHGHGMVYNIGERSHGVTSLLWTFILAPLTAFLGNTVQVWKACGAVFFALGAGFIWLSLERAASQRARLLCVLPCILAPFTLRWSSTGMENGLTALSLGLFTFISEHASRGAQPRSDGRWVVTLGALAGALPFVRPELALASATVIMLTPMWAGRGRAFWRVLVSSSSVGVLLALMSLASFGSLLPQTAAAKFSTTPSMRSWSISVTVITRSVSGRAGSASVVLEKWSPAGSRSAVRRRSAGTVARSRTEARKRASWLPRSVE